MKFVYFSMQINVTHLCVGVCVVVTICLSSALVGGLCGWIGKLLFTLCFG